MTRPSLNPGFCALICVCEVSRSVAVKPVAPTGDPVALNVNVAGSLATDVRKPAQRNPPTASPGQNCAARNNRSNSVDLSPVAGVITTAPAAGVPGGKAFTTLETTPTEQIAVATDAIAKASCRLFLESFILSLSGCEERSSDDGGQR